ncbi:MAG: yahF [Clostridiales bacterium]|nr:yahF [Clostridiales bacterium]
MSYAIIKRNTYYDSVTLMIITSEITKIPGVKEASICMGTELNKELLVDSGLSNPDTENATANDLIIAFETSDSSVKDTVLKTVEGLLKKKNESAGSSAVAPVSLKTGLAANPNANLAIISVPGRYAYIEAQKALLYGLNVMLFSDNVSLEEEKMLKTYASKKGLLMMGPDCGTSIINNKGLCFANEIRKGKIGVIGASGTGLQEVTVLVDRYGGGVTQAIGVGGRDLSDEIGGIMMLDVLESLKKDSETEVILLLSKQPSQSVANKIITAAENCSKPVVICFMGNDESMINRKNLFFVSTLEKAALKCLELIGIMPDIALEDLSFSDEYAKKLLPEQKYVKGLFCGGTLCSEAKHIFHNCLAEAAKFKATDEKLLTSKGHTFLDLGDDMFTVGKPHPMIDPTVRNARIVQEAKNSETAVILLDFVIGYGSNEDPVGVALKAIEEAKAVSTNIVIVAYVCGSENDHQGLQKQKDKLTTSGVIIADSNAQAARIAAEVIRRKKL